METKKGSYVWLDSKNNQPVKIMSKWVCADTGALLMDSQIKHFYEYGGEKVVFDKEELTQAKTFDVAGVCVPCSFLLVFKMNAQGSD